ncbi:hypothetical protein V6N13_047280 [Hibiscus sabdariffa]
MISTAVFRHHSNLLSRIWLLRVADFGTRRAVAAVEKTMQQEPAKLQIQSETGFKSSPAPYWSAMLQQSNIPVQSPSGQQQPESQLSWPREV